jgi:quercetin dioxygenase-like cupin family protein
LWLNNPQEAAMAEIRIAPNEFEWPAGAGPGVGTSLMREVETMVLKGDPSKPGLYTILLRIAPNTRIHPHSHQDDRIATVVSGTWYFAYGDEFDESVLKELPPGSFYTEPPGVNHFGLTREEVLIQMTGIGPSSTAYVNPEHDPTFREA